MNMAIGKLRKWSSLALIFLLTACATNGKVDRQNVDTTIQINHGIVENVQQVELKSEAAKGAVLGGIVGLVAVHGSTAQNVGGAIGGALAGALLTRALEGSNKANAYTVLLNKGSEVKVVTESKHIEIGDCVAIESGKTTNIRRVSAILCEPSKPHPVDKELESVHYREAQECHEAKKQLLQAETEADISALERKVRALCEH